MLIKRYNSLITIITKIQKNRILPVIFDANIKLQAMQSIRDRKYLTERIKSRIHEIRRGDNFEMLSEVSRDKTTTVITNVRLAEIFKVTPQTIWNWRTDGIIKGKEIAPQVWEYNLFEVISDLEKFT